MAEDPPAGGVTPPAEPPPPNAGGVPPPDPDEPTDAEGWRRYVARINRESAQRRRENEALQVKLKEHEDAQKSELERERERANAAEARAKQVETHLLRQRIGIAAQLPPELIERIVGDDEETMRADAARLVKFARPNGDLGAGKGGQPGPPADDMNARIRAAAGRT